MRLALLVVLPLAMVLAVVQWRQRLARLGEAKYFHYCADAGAAAAPEYAVTLDLGRKYRTEKWLFALLLSLLTAIIFGGYYAVMSASGATGRDVEIAVGVTWFMLAVLYGIAWKSLFDTLHESRLYESGRGNEIALKGNDLFASIALFEGQARDVLRLHNRPFLRLPLDEVTELRVCPARVTGRVPTPACLKFVFADCPGGFHMLRAPLKEHEKQLVGLLESRINVPVKRDDVLR